MINSRNDYGIVHLRWEKRHELILPANSGVTQHTSVTDSEETQKVQSQVGELHRQVESLEAKLKYARKQKKELEDELAQVERENHNLKNGEARLLLVSKLGDAQSEVQRLRQENQELQNKLQTGGKELPIEPVRDHTLNKLKAGRQSAAGKAIDAFIKKGSYGSGIRQKG